MADTTKILPKLRFPEFAYDGEWEKVKINRHFFSKNRKNYSVIDKKRKYGYCFGCFA